MGSSQITDMSGKYSRGNTCQMRECYFQHQCSMEKHVQVIAVHLLLQTALQQALSSGAVQ